MNQKINITYQNIQFLYKIIKENPNISLQNTKYLYNLNQNYFEECYSILISSGFIKYRSNNKNLILNNDVGTELSFIDFINPKIIGTFHSRIFDYLKSFIKKNDVFHNLDYKGEYFYEINFLCSANILKMNLDESFRLLNYDEILKIIKKNQSHSINFKEKDENQLEKGKRAEEIALKYEQNRLKNNLDLLSRIDSLAAENPTLSVHAVLLIKVS